MSLVDAMSKLLLGFKRHQTWGFAQPKRELPPKPVFLDGLGWVTSRAGGRWWLASVELEDPAVMAQVKLPGDREGPWSSSQRRALRLLRRWRALADGPVMRALKRRVPKQPQQHSYRVAPSDQGLFEQHPIKLLVVDLRSAKPRLILRFKGIDERIALSLSNRMRSR